MDASAGQQDEPQLSLDGDGKNPTPEAPTSESPTEASMASGAPLRTRDVGVFEDLPSAADNANPLPTPRATGRGASASRPRGWLAYLVFLVLMLMALLLRFAVFNAPQATRTGSRVATSTQPPDATATTAPTAADTPLPGITPNATLPVSTGGGPVPTPGPEIPFTVTAAEISTSPRTYDQACLPPETMPENLQGAVYVPGTTPGGTITYRWRFSDGTITPVESVVIGPTNMPSFYGAANDQLIEGKWVIDPAIADGSSKWAKFEVLTPSHLLSPPSYFWFKCEFSVHDATSAVSIGSGGSAPQYNCIAGGDQTFTFTGTIGIYPDPHSHTVNYHWLRSDGSQGPDLSVTLAPGQFSASVQPDIVVVTYAQAQAKPGNLWEKVVLTSNPDIHSNLASYFVYC